ncbi:MAG: N-acetylmuramoyl-L-alanine amidase [Candidatus Dormibacteraeota bacterium]|nr:N-acetylmuramoyl-L-alanine amidase [Candidatus Dormibacteraeota bacterium]
MRHPVTRLLHVLLSVPVLAAAAIAASPVAHASTDPHTARVDAPAPLVIVIDPGHGGIPNPAAPDMPFDPGAIAASNGLMEKDATLAVSKLLQSLLVQDDVNAVLTRTDDTGMTVQQREDVANSNHAALFMSVHFNSFTDAVANGALVLYPRDTDLAFAQAVSNAMAGGLSSVNVADDGVVLRDNWWIRTTMPTVTVEPAYVSNPREAALVASPSFQLLLAQSLRAGIESYDPQVLQRKAEIVAWNAAHPAQTVTPHPTAKRAAVPVAAAPATGVGWLVRDVALVVMLSAVGIWPRASWRLVRLVSGVVAFGGQRMLVRRAAIRRRRRAVQRRAYAMRAERFARPHHIYDELF